MRLVRCSFRVVMVNGPKTQGWIKRVRLRRESSGRSIRTASIGAPSVDALRLSTLPLLVEFVRKRNRGINRLCRGRQRANLGASDQRRT